MATNSRFGAKPNGVTWFALDHPVAWTLLSSSLIGLQGLAIFRDWRAGAAGGVTVLLANCYLWRPNGPFRRWADRQRRLTREVVAQHGGPPPTSSVENRILQPPTTPDTKPFN